MADRSVVVAVAVAIGVGIAFLATFSVLFSGPSSKPAIVTEAPVAEHIDMTIEGLESAYVPGELIVFSVKLKGLSDSGIVCNSSPPLVVIRDDESGEETVLNPIRFSRALACVEPVEFDIAFPFGDDEEIAVDKEGSYTVLASYESQEDLTAERGFEARDDAALRAAKNKEIMAQAQELFAKQQEEYARLGEYQQQLENATTEEEKQELEMKMQASLDEIDRLDKQLRALERVNISLYRLESELEQRLYAAEKILIDKYTNPSSDSYVGENPVEIINVDILARTLVILVNPDKVAPDGSNVPRETKVDGFPVKIEYGKIELI